MSTSQPQDTSALTEVEEYLRTRFQGKREKVQSTALAPPRGKSTRVDQLVLPDEERAKLPETKEKYIVRENPHLVAWEREVRKFLRRLSPQHGHRVTAAMVYEWATGIKVAELYAKGGSAKGDLIRLNKILVFYFGKPYMTYILGKKVPKAYRVPPGWYVKRHRPMTLTLFHEYSQGTIET